MNYNMNQNENGINNNKFIKYEEIMKINNNYNKLDDECCNDNSNGDN